MSCYPRDDEQDQQDGGSHRDLAVVDARLLPACESLLDGIEYPDGIDTRAIDGVLFVAIDSVGHPALVEHLADAPVGEDDVVGSPVPGRGTRTAASGTAAVRPHIRKVNRDSQNVRVTSDFYIGIRFE